MLRAYKFVGLFARACTLATVTAASLRKHSLRGCRLLEVNPDGSVPVVKDKETDEWFVDSAKFVDYTEDKHPEPALGKSTDAPEV